MRANSIPELSSRVAAKFWSYVEVHQPSGCWEWTRFCTHRGYGRYGVPDPTSANGRRGFYTHRIAYTLLIGPIGEHTELHHLCQNQRCCNPDHLALIEPNLHRSLSRQYPRPAFVNRTHCKRGHEYTPENTRREADGSRRCRACTNQRQRDNWHAGKRYGKAKNEVQS